MGIKRKTRDIGTRGKAFIARYNLHQHWYTCPIVLPMRRNPQHRSLLTVISTHFAPPFQPLRHQLHICQQAGFLADQADGSHTSHHKQGCFLYEYTLHWVLLHTKTHNIPLLSGGTLLKHGRHFDYWNRPLNMRIRVCYLDCDEAGVCCYLVLRIENLLRPLQLFSFHLWPIYWLSLVVLRSTKQREFYKTFRVSTDSCNFRDCRVFSPDAISVPQFSLLRYLFGPVWTSLQTTPDNARNCVYEEYWDSCRHCSNIVGTVPPLKYPGGPSI
jgi:hypothetical protein